MNLILRDNKIDYLDMCSDIYLKTYSDVKWDLEKIKYNLSTILLNQFSCLILKMNSQNQCVGFVIGNTYYFGEYKYGKIDELCVLPEYQKSGLGTELINYVISYLKNDGCTSVYLETYTFLSDFYIKSGLEIAKDKLFFYKIL